MVYCGISLIKLNKNIDQDFQEIEKYKKKYYEIPKIFLFKENFYVNSKTLKKCIEIESLFKTHLICYDINNELLTDNENNYLNNWNAEKYRKNL